MDDSNRWPRLVEVKIFGSCPAEPVLGQYRTVCLERLTNAMKTSEKSTVTLDAVSIREVSGTVAWFETP